MAGKRYDLSLSLLDRQIIDKDGFAAGKVDDIEFERRDGAPPYAVKILSGPGALSGRIGGRLGRWIAAVHVRLHESPHPGPAEVSFGVVSRIDNAVHVNVSRDDLPSIRFAVWVRDRLVDKIPGAGHEAE